MEQLPFNVSFGGSCHGPLRSAPAFDVFAGTDAQERRSCCVEDLFLMESFRRRRCLGREAVYGASDRCKDKQTSFAARDRQTRTASRSGRELDGRSLGAERGVDRVCLDAVSPNSPSCQEQRRTPPYLMRGWCLVCNVKTGEVLVRGCWRWGRGFTMAMAGVSFATANADSADLRRIAQRRDRTASKYASRPRRGLHRYPHKSGSRHGGEKATRLNSDDIWSAILG